MLEEIKIDVLPSYQSHHTENMKHMSSIINESFKAAEKGIWSPGTTRTSVEEITKLTRQGEMIAAFEEKEKRIVGCAQIHRLDSETGEINMLAVDRTYQGQGIAGRIIHFAEKKSLDYNLTKMQLEVLMPKQQNHSNQLFLKNWYHRLGYQHVDTEAMDTTFPELAPKLAMSSEFVVFQKELTN